MTGHTDGARPLDTRAAIPDPPRVAWRKHMRRRVLDAARDLTCSSGWDQVSLSAVATAAEVSRPSVYKEFGNRAGLGRALVLRETREFLESVALTLYPGLPDPCASLEAAVFFVLTEAHRNPLIRAVVLAARKGSDSLLPYLTARADPIFDAGQNLLRTWLTERFPERDEDLIDTAADIAVRMTISHLVLPGADPRPTAQRLSLAVLKVLQ
ncbi:TetR family transcriptional regulator [Kitasatospora arboriphila]|uniref:TetR/AcrR family transcriptional regulator n=2 Tax=Kitasatospora TaxID=2063 RepID=A0ABN1TNF4_9ACTN